MSALNIYEYREKFDNDDRLASKRKILIISSLLLLAISLSGASIKEANTFIFRVEFSNHSGLTYLLGVTVFFMLLRYYAYAEEYHSKLSDLWAARLLGDYRVFSYDPREDEVQGLLGKAVRLWGGDEPGIRDIKYKKVGIFKRNLVYLSRGYDENDGDIYYEMNIELNKYTQHWNRKDFYKLLKLEFICRLEGVFKYREYFDLMLPYVVGACSLISLTYRYINQ